MYIYTFYSFKGGVGRTQGLVNVAAELARRGRRVLLVDFDLEAPGITTFALPFTPPRLGGIVEYVSQYLTTSVAPDVSAYVSEFSRIGDSGGGIWIMPAGRADAEYGERLNAINWGRLYDEQEGYFLFEDLKLEWRNALSPDYVFVDSRTGHTDIGGICTRQLPDAVAIFFLPNDQNLSGLPKVVNDIRDESSSQQRKVIQLDFVVSNVPNIDDDDGILQTRLARFQEALKYDALSGTIHRYDSLALLDQTVFTLARPRTRLAEQYRLLANKLIENNLADRQGAVTFLANYSRQVRLMTAEQREIAGKKLDDVGKMHAKDPDILQRLGRLRFREGKFDDAVNLFDQVIAAGTLTAEALLDRAEVRFVRGEKEAAATDLRQMLDRSGATDVDVTRAVGWLRELDKSALRGLADRRAVWELNTKAQISLATDLEESDRDGQYAAVGILTRLIEGNLGTAQLSEALQGLGLSLIGLGRFREAREKLEELPGLHESIRSQFNYAMARWGEFGTPDLALFTAVAEKDNGEADMGGPNYPQCMALIYGVLGDSAHARKCLDEARVRSRAARHRIFSCWRYAAVSPAAFAKDLDEMELLVGGKHELPTFIAAQRDLAL